MISQIAFFPIFGKPLIMYGGVIAFFCLLLTAMIPVFLQKKWPKVFSYQAHVWLARITVALALLHGSLGLMLYF